MGECYETKDTLRNIQHYTFIQNTPSHTYTHKHVHIHTHTHMHAYTLINTHAHTHKFTHTNIRSSKVETSGPSVHVNSLLVYLFIGLPLFQENGSKDFLDIWHKVRPW